MYAPIFHGWFRRQRHILLRMDLSSDCLLQCIHCYRSSCPPHFNSIKAEQIHLLEREVFPFIHRLDLSTIGEPLTSPFLPQVISAAKRAGVVCVGMTTNGMLLTEEIARDLLERGIGLVGGIVGCRRQVAPTRESGAVGIGGSSWRTSPA